ERELESERAKSEKLLLNILPTAIAERLKKGEEPIADRFENVAVLFADICQFTKMSSTLEPEKVVAMLNEIFSSFDHWCGEYGLEKIKTIGDAYMAVGGLKHGSVHHVRDTLRFAQKMLLVLTEHPELKDRGLAIRVGVHVGPVVAGVIGKNKFIYDLWGDTVNTASRMESSGVDGRVHVSEQVMELGKAHFSFSSRGKIEVKGKGEMRTYLLEKEIS
ncbi:MAG: adenylate/guanylate cyclase domain-containing protein, partial [Spirochaetia bacterium]|nr:adenylate/guanylate cyclase domain-containing protein [Spirochaetia bacterium]